MKAAAARLATAIVVVLTWSGCNEASGPETTTVADSAGIDVVTNLPASVEQAETWSLSAEPVAEIGAGVSPDVALYRVTGVAPLADGRVVVGANAPPQVLAFGRDGSLVATLGREGEGPGEFTSVGSVVPIAADSVAVWDPSRRHISVFGADGGHAREVDVSALAPLSAWSAPDNRSNSGFTHVLPSSPGSLILFGEGLISSDPAPGVQRPALPAHRITTEGDELADFGTFPGMEVVQPDGFPLPLGARTYGASAGETLVVGTADSPELRVYGPTGELVRIVRWADHERTLAGPQLATWNDMVEAQTEMREIARALPQPERFPAYMDLVGTDDGRVLVGDYPGPLGVWPLRRADDGPEWGRPELRMPARRWLVFDADGALTATLHTPEGFEPYVVRDGRLWGVFTDELDVESVRAYEIRTP